MTKENVGPLDLRTTLKTYKDERSKGFGRLIMQKLLRASFSITEVQNEVTKLAKYYYQDFALVSYSDG
jgi:hypothetical protein